MCPYIVTQEMKTADGYTYVELFCPNCMNFYYTKKVPTNEKGVIKIKYKKIRNQGQASALFFLPIQEN